MITGENGMIDGLTCLRRWRIVDKALPASGVCSASEGAEFLEPGNTDWQGVANSYGATPAIDPGTLFQFTGSNGTSGYDSGSAGAYLDQVVIHWNVEDAGLIYHDLFFSGAKALTAGTYTVDLDDVAPAPASAMGLSCSLGGSEFSIRNASLTISCPGVPYNDSSTAGATSRVAGNWAASFELDAYFDSYSSLPTKNTLQAFSIEASSTTNWTMNYMLITEVLTDIAKADQNGRAIPNTCKIKGRWSGWSDSTQGVITSPAAATLWPTA